MEDNSTKIFISIVLVAYNEGELIECCIGKLSKALENVKHKAEIVFVNNGSTDDTISRAINAFKNSLVSYKLKVLDRNLGLSGGFLEGVKVADGDWVMVFPADAEFTEDDFNRYFNEANTGVGAVAGQRGSRPGYSNLVSKLSCFYNKFLQVSSGINIRDFNWITLYRKSDLLNSLPKSRSIFFLPEILINLSDKGKEIKSVEAPVISRKSGRPSVSRPSVWFRTTLDITKFFFCRSISATLFLIILGLIGLASSLYGWPALDEGIFIQYAKNMGNGALPYVDFPSEYGPLFLHLNALYFKIFGYSHMASRIATCIICFGTFLLLTFSVKCKNNLSFVSSAIFPAMWFLSASQKFSESLHPGWYITFILAFEAYILVKNYSRKQVLLAILAGLMFGFKPHIALFNLIVISLILLPHAGAYFLRYLIVFSYLLIAGLVLQSAITTAGVIYLLPFLLSSVFLLHFALNSGDVDIRRGFPFFFFLIVGLVVMMVYLPAFSAYGFKVVKFSMFDLPKSAYPNFYSFYSGSQGSDFSSSLAIISLFILLLISFYKKSPKYFLILATLSAGAFLLSIEDASLYAYIFTTLGLVCILFRTQPSYEYNILMLSTIQILHLHPVLGTQLYYATPLVWLLLGRVCVVSILSSRGIILIFMSMFVSIVIRHPFLFSLFRGDKLSYVDNMICEDGGKLILNYSKEDLRVVEHAFKFLKMNLLNSSPVLTIPPYYSLNLCLNFPVPTNIVTSYWSYLPVNLQIREISNILRGKFLVLFPSSTRFNKEVQGGKLSTLVYSQAMKEFEPIPQEIWAPDLEEQNMIQIYKKKEKIE